MGWSKGDDELPMYPEGEIPEETYGFLQTAFRNVPYGKKEDGGSVGKVESVKERLEALRK